MYQRGGLSRGVCHGDGILRGCGQGMCPRKGLCIPPPRHGQPAVGTHPAGMHSCNLLNASRKPQEKGVYRRTREMPQRARTFQVNCCLKVHNAHLKLLSSISG